MGNIGHRRHARQWNDRMLLMTHHAIHLPFDRFEHVPHRGVDPAPRGQDVQDFARIARASRGDAHEIFFAEMRRRSAAEELHDEERDVAVRANLDTETKERLANAGKGAVARASFPPQETIPRACIRNALRDHEAARLESRVATGILSHRFFLL